MTSLNPVLTIGEQIMEVIENHNTSLSSRKPENGLKTCWREWEFLRSALESIPTSFQAV